MILNKKEQKANRIPVRFVDEEHAEPDDEQQGHDDGEAETDGLSSEELGRASSYEGETEMQRRIDRGGEDGTETGGAEADDKDAAGGPPVSETPERREDLDTKGAQNASAPPQSGDDESNASAPESAAQASGPMLAELIATRSELKRLESERQDLVDKLSRRQADFENYRKRTERERSDTYHRMVGDVVGKLLPVMDNMRRALEAESLLEKSESKEFSHFLHGVELIYKQLNDVLEELGVQPVSAVGQPFDPHLHEAVATERSDDYEPDTVIQELLRGYLLGGKLLRPAMVKVSTR
jgi:Molecular chaperone GrpE (heat shock protein)